MSGGIPIPGLASWLSDPSTGTKTVVQGLDTVPEDQRPTIREVNTVHLAWDVMVGLGTLLMLLALWYFASWIFRRDMPKGRWFLRIAAVRGGPGGHRDGGGVGRERGRPAAVDRVRVHEGGGRRDREHRRVDHLPRGRRPLHRRRGDDHPRASRHEPAVPRRTAPMVEDVPYGPRARPAVTDGGKEDP